MRRLLRALPALAACPMLFTGCQDNGSGGGGAQRAAKSMMSPAAPPPAAEMRVGGGENSGAPLQRFLEERHSLRISLARDALRTRFERDLQLAREAGAEVLVASIDEDQWTASATLSLRVPPARLDALLAQLAEGKASHEISSTDRTSEVLDVEARLKARLLLRERLETMLKERAGMKISELLEVERELARLQGEIESITAQRKHLETVTAKVAVAVSYQSSAGSRGVDLSPLRGIGTDMVDTFVQSVAGLVTFFAAALPWVPVIMLIVWLVRRRRRRLAQAQSQTTAALTLATPTDLTP